MRAVAALVLLFVAFSGCQDEPAAKPAVFDAAQRHVAVATATAQAWSPDAVLYMVLGSEEKRPRTGKDEPELFQWLGLDPDPDVGDGRCSTWGYVFFQPAAQDQRFIVVLSGGGDLLMSRAAGPEETFLEPVAWPREWKVDSDAAADVAVAFSPGWEPPGSVPSSIQYLLVAQPAREGNATEFHWSISVELPGVAESMLVDAHTGAARANA